MMKHPTGYRCPLTLTNKAKGKLRELGMDGDSFFSLDSSFRILIEKYPETSDRLMSVALFIDREKNAPADNVLILHCVVERERLLAKNITTKKGRTTLETNWRRAVDMTFDLNVQRGSIIPLDLLHLISEMPVAKESSEYVKKRIASWEGYLKIQERAADIPDITTRFNGLSFNGDFSRMTISGCKLNEKDWKSLKGLSVKLKGIDQDVGKVLKANRTALSVEVELHGYMEERARQQRLDMKEKEVVFSNFAALSQVKRLRQGFRHLENGLAANPELERLLFENKPPVRVPKKQAVLKFHNRLNEFQQAAVQGAMSVEDIYVIQGPPGTGKTTVISEICLQNARAGLRTLVASQSNLAVDNALGRLLANKDIRILRVGRTESIEEEGKRFIEENVGQYWKEHTLREVASHVEAGKRRTSEVEIEWAENVREQEQLKPELTRVELEIQKKQQAQKQYSEIEVILVARKKSKELAEQEMREAVKFVEDSQQVLRSLDESIESDETFLQTEVNGEAIQIELERCEHEMKQLRFSIECQELRDRIEEVRQATEQATLECDNSNALVVQMEALREKISHISRIDGLRWAILEHSIELPIQVEQLFDELRDVRKAIEQLEKLKQYNETLTKAITYVESLLAKYGISYNAQEARSIHRGYTAEEIDQFLAELRSKLVKRTNISSKMLSNYLEGLCTRRSFVWQKRERLESFETYKRLAKEGFEKIKQEVVKQLAHQQQETTQSHQKQLQLLETLSKELHSLQQQYQEMKPTEVLIANAQDILPEKEAEIKELKQKKEQYEQVLHQLEATNEKREELASQLRETVQGIALYEENVAQLDHLIFEKEKQLVALKDILATEPEKEQEKLFTKLASLQLKGESLKGERQKLPLFVSIQGKWLSLLEEANDHDLEEIRKLYVKHANVIGTTCVASARKDFIDNYPEFDVVIIDEVSKATPPELLLPMLKGKKIILVGDHHQLPPLLGDDTLEETLQELADETDDFEGKAELKKLLKESLFERLYKNLPKSHKTMLAIQYRMHEDIMTTIAPFYAHENERLQCGLPDSDSARDHGLESSLIQRNNHLVWVDLPNEPAFFEERMKGGKSLYNPAELSEISQLLQQLDDAAEQAKQAGRIGQDEKKSIGVISFYGEQVKRIEGLIHQELTLRHVTVRSGTVDRFQGMEMDIILLSMVRNHDNSRDDIGFAKDYRRLNVALSRAKELLVLIGSTKMFTERTKQADTRQMYTHVLETVKQQRGLRTLEGVK